MVEVKPSPRRVSREAFLSALSHALGCLLRVDAAQADKLYRHYCLMVRWNAAVGLTTVLELERAVLTHYSESLFLAKLLPSGPLRVLDLGSGAGFPGIPIAAYRPDCKVWLCERRLKKAAFLKEATRGWTNVSVIREVEEFEGQCDWLVARAVNTGEVLSVARERARWLGLLLSEGVARELSGAAGILPVARRRIPWAEQRLVWIARVT